MRRMLAESRILTFPRVRMIIAGWVSIAFSYLVFIFLVQVGVHYQIASLANFFAYIVINFFLNRKWAFKSNGSAKVEALSHTFLHAGNQAMIMLGLYVLVEHAHIHAIWAQAIMQVLATVTVFFATPIIFKGKR